VHREHELTWVRYKGANPRHVMDFVPRHTRAMLSRELFLGYLQRTPLFDGLNLVFLHSLVEVCRFDAVPAGTMLFRGGRLYHEVRIVVEGESRELQPNKGGIQQAFQFRQQQDLQLDLFARRMEDDAHISKVGSGVRCTMTMFSSLGPASARAASDNKNKHNALHLKSALDLAPEEEEEQKNLVVRGLDLLWSPVPVPAAHSVIAISSLDTIVIKVPDLHALLADHVDVRSELSHRTNLLDNGGHSGKHRSTAGGQLDISAKLFMRIHSSMTKVLSRVRKRIFDRRREAERWRHQVHLQDSPFRMRWHLVGFVLAVVQVATVPALLAFGLNTPLFTLLVMTDAFFVYDLFLRARYFARKHVNGIDLAITPGDISLSFFRLGWGRVMPLATHFAAVLPLDKAVYLLMYLGTWGSQGNEGPSEHDVLVLGLLHLLHLSRFPTYSRNINEYTSRVLKMNIGYRVREVITLTFSLSLMVHLLACFWFVAGAAGGADSWYFSKVRDVQLLPLAEQYLYSVYWAVVTISTTGYGDIFAISQAEMICFITTAFLAAVTNAAIIGSKATSAAHKVRRHRYFVRRVTDTTHYLRDRGVDQATQTRMLEYFSYIVDNDTIMYDLMMPLVRRAELRREMHQPLLAVVDTLCFPVQSQLSEGFLFELAQRMHPHIYLPHDVIVREGDVGDGLYILHEGNAKSGALAAGAVRRGQGGSRASAQAGLRWYPRHLPEPGPLFRGAGAHAAQPAPHRQRGGSGPRAKLLRGQRPVGVFVGQLLYAPCPRAQRLPGACIRAVPRRAAPVGPGQERASPESGGAGGCRAARTHSGSVRCHVRRTRRHTR
jgi:CRP-like cAMP-binding protein